MAIKFPQIDYPRGSLPRGGSDIWDTPQASVVLADDMFAAAGPAPTVLTGNNVASTATSTQGAVGQTHALSGNACRQNTTATQAAIVQTNVVTGNSARQDNTSASGAVTQLHMVAGNSVAQGTTSAVSAASQNHVLSGASAAQPNASTAGDVTVPAVAIVLTGNSCRTDHTSSAGACIQEHLLAGNSASGDSSCAAGGVGQSHKLAGSACIATTEGQSASISQTHSLSAASDVYASVAQSGGIEQLHQLSGESVYQSALLRRIVEYIEPKCMSWLIRPDTHTANIVMDAMTAFVQQPMMTANMLDGYSIYQQLDTFSVEIRQCYKS